MATKAQKKAARENIKKAQQTWQNMSSRQRSLAQPEGADRAKPGSKGSGKFYRIEVRPSSQFKTFRTHDVGEPGGIERVAGQRKSGSWDTQAWLISKDKVEKNKGSLVALDGEAKEVLDQLSSKPEHIKGDIFKAHPRKNVPEEEKPTKAQQRARKENIEKAQKARWA